MSKDFSWKTKSPSSTKEMIEIRIFKFFNLFSKIWKMWERYKADNTGGKAEPCLTPMSTLKRGEEKLFQRYFIFLPTR